MEYGAISIDTNALRHEMFTVIKCLVASFKQIDDLQGVPSKLRICTEQDSYNFNKMLQEHIVS